MAGMTDSLHKTEARLNEKIAEARSAGDTQQHAAYTAAETDLRMLMVLVSSKS
jgi:transcription elongation GreA/GreB family factor